MKHIRAAVARLSSSAVLWFWGVNALRFGSGLLLLPLLLHHLTREDLGYYFILQNLFAIVPLIDFGVAISIDRQVGYAMGGAAELNPQGVSRAPEGTHQPNYSLIWKLMDTTRAYYHLLSIALFFVMGVVVTVIAWLAAPQTSSPNLAWLAAGIALLSLVFEIYWGWWNTFLCAMNRVQLSARIAFIGYLLRLTLSCTLLLAGVGVASVFLSGFFTSFLIRWAARRECLSILPARQEPRLSRAERWRVLRVLWPNSWRVGLQLLSGYLAVNANSLICWHFFGLSINAQYGLSLQIATIIQSMSAVWTSVKWPLISQLRARWDDAGLRQLLRPRVLLQSGTFIIGAVAAVVVGPPLVEWIRPDKQLLPVAWFALLLLQAFFDLQVRFWTTFLATENRVPSLWPVTITNCASVAVVVVFVHLTGLQAESFVLAGLVAGSLFNYWYWPVAGARNLKTTWWRFLFGRGRDSGQWATAP
jgi:O-antigen/teichoic acid export membrane protein